MKNVQIDLAALREYVEGSGIAFRQNSVSWILTCPKCAKEKLYIRKSDGRFACWKCKGDGYEGRPEYALKDLLNLPIKHIQAKLYGIGELPSTVTVDVSLTDFWGEDVEEDDEEEIAVTKRAYWPLDYYEIDHKHSAQGRKYLEEERGIPIDLALKYGTRFSPEEQRVVFPVVLDGDLVGWQKRAIFKTEAWNEEEGVLVEVPKILSSKGLSGIRDSCLMFGDRLVNSKHAVVCEGPIDAIKCDLVGGNVATMGKAMGQGQIEAVKRSGVRRVYLALDPDAAGELARLTREFADFEVYKLVPPAPFKDLGQMTPEAVLNLFFVAERINAGQVFVHLDHLGARKAASRRERWC